MSYLYLIQRPFKCPSSLLFRADPDSRFREKTKKNTDSQAFCSWKMTHRSLPLTLEVLLFEMNKKQEY